MRDIIFYLSGVLVGFWISHFIKDYKRRRAMRQAEKLKGEFLEMLEAPLKELGDAIETLIENNEVITSKEQYDILYEYLKQEDGTIHCGCGDVEGCELIKPLKNYRLEHPEVFTEEELNRNDNLRAD